MDNIRDTVIRLHREGYSMIPSGKGAEGKSPSVSWEAYQKKPPSEGEIRAWMRLRNPTLWGLVTGEVSGVVIVDCDPGADQTIMNGLEPHVKTPRGGSHYWFEHPGKPVKTCAGILPKIDIRGDGGFANVVGVNPRTGGKYIIKIMPVRDRLYSWDRMPKQILEAMEKGKDRQEAKPGEPIPEGKRDSTLTSMAGSMRKRGMTQAAIEAALLTENRDRCQPPLEDEQVAKIARSVSRYPPADTHLTDTGNAEYMAKLYGDKLRYDHRRKRWLHWGPHCWVPDKDGQVSRLAIGAAKARYISAADIKDSQEKKVASSWAISSESKMRVDACISLASRIKPFADKGDTWDTNRMLLGCENGIIDLSTGELRAGRPEDRITMSTGMSFDPNAECPRWEKFLEEIFDDDKELIDWLWRTLGYSITGDTTEQIFLVGYGEGGNGKSSFFSVICSVLGDYAYTSPFSTFKLPEPSSSNDLATLELRRFVTSCETNKGVSLNLERIKTLTGEDRITARYLYKEFETYPPHLKIWLFVNEKPEITDDTTATWRRLRVVPFNKQFLKEDRDLRLGEKLRAEAQGILAWLVRGCLEWQRRGLSDLPECVRARTVEYMHEADTARTFIEGYCVVGKDEEVRGGVLYSAYKRWAVGTVDKRRILSLTAFGTYMTKRFEKYEDRRGVHYLGIDLRDKVIHVDLTEG